ncbi:hypothetical protein [Limnohabitans sp. WS1]|jgi:hypothetical protein|uniref:hypothetical protein n=1 Tax=Limnohabitans sp. WS1 TaxID=1100726 RepID=UPI000D38D730|nr:hypothetical protein [Limnohabitans sp. WS1]PUE18811.1 hypothetical protein B9Z48_08260 [Limnohabitans sp. WS1]
MEKKSASSPQEHAILGHDIPKARLTVLGWTWGALYMGLPVILLGNLLDFFFQWTLGWCIGVWCIV